MSFFLTSFVPAVIILAVFRLLGIWWGLGALVLFLAVNIFVKLPDYLMIIAGMKYKKNPQKSLVYMEKALKTKRLRVDYILYYGFVCLKLGDTDRAARVLAAANGKKMSPATATRAAVNRALLHWKQDDMQGAIAILEEELKTAENAAVYGTLGQLLILDKQFQHAMELNERAYAFDKYDEAITDNLALSYYVAGDLDSSRNIYKQLTGKRLGVPLPYYNYGETLYALGEKEEAVEMMEKALSYPFSELAVKSKTEIRARVAEIKAELA